MTDVYVIKSNRNTGISVRVTDKYHKETVASLFPGSTINSFDVTSQMAKLASLGAISYLKKEVVSGAKVDIHNNMNDDRAKLVEKAEISKIDKDPIIEKTPDGDIEKLDETVVSDSDSGNSIVPENFSKSYKKSNKR